MLSVFVGKVTRFNLLSQTENSQTNNFFDNLNMYKTSHDSKQSYKKCIEMALVSQLRQIIGLSVTYVIIVFICTGENDQIQMPFLEK